MNSFATSRIGSQLKPLPSRATLRRDRERQARDGEQQDVAHQELQGMSL